MLGFLGKKSIATSPPVVKNSDIARGYQKRPSIASYLPWRDYNERHKVFLLEDNQSLAVGFRITPLACEARPQAMLEAIAKSLQDALQNAIPCEKANPWILQLFVQREQNLSLVIEKIKQAIPAERHNEPLVKAHLQTLQKHIEYITRPGGVFFDQQVTQQIFRGGRLKVYAVLYRRNNTSSDKNQRRTHLEAIQHISRKLAEQWRACGLGVKRLTGEAFYHWLMPWFNPQPKQTAGDVNALLSQITFPQDQEKPFGWDLSEQLFFSAPESHNEGWLFDGRPHKVITIQNLSSEPVIGHITAERKRGTDDKVFNLIDHLPEGSIFSLSIVFQAQSEVELHLKLIHDSAVGRHALAMKVKGEIEEAQQAIANGDYLLPTVMAVYIQGDNYDQLQEREAHTEVLLNSNGFKVITDDELHPVDAYLRYLPMSYDFHFDKKNTYRSRYLLLSDIAKLLPVYGRSCGTENPGMLMFNRGGEPWFYDIIADRTKNAHFLLLGETGTGKSNTLNFLIMHNLALYNPRFFIIDAGGSFDLLADYCQSLGLQVHKVKIDPKNPISLN
ncbi:MAG TPA: conjugative transfer ATPase, partial [Gammaproteobacteria bacterium]|nr:conjugative transfer ATPase [Gammaproteobacteria bacterium]